MSDKPAWEPVVGLHEAASDLRKAESYDMRLRERMNAAPVGVILQKSTIQTLTTNVTAKIEFGDPEFNPYDWTWDGTNHQLLIPEAGWYQVSLYVGYAANATGDRITTVRDNGTGLWTAREFSPDGARTTHNGFSIPLLLAEGDLIEGAAYQDSGGNLALSPTNGLYATMSVFKIH